MSTEAEQRDAENLAGVRHMQRVHAQVEMEERTRPCVIFPPRLTQDGDTWIACFGANLQEGVVGTGASPGLAMADFDQAWWAEEPASQSRQTVTEEFLECLLKVVRADLHRITTFPGTKITVTESLLMQALCRAKLQPHRSTTLFVNGHTISLPRDA